LENLKGSIKAKYCLAFFLLAGVKMEKGVSPWQDFDLLVDLRNSLIHPKLDRIVDTSTGPISAEGYRIATPGGLSVKMEYPTTIDKLDRKGILAPRPKENVITSWTQIISTPAVAKWAVNTRKR